MFTSATTREEEFDFGPRLWDATPGACCAAYQLGACAHTEAAAEEEPEFVAERTDATTGVRYTTYRYSDGEEFTVEAHPQPAPEPFDWPFGPGEEPF